MGCLKYTYSEKNSTLKVVHSLFPSTEKSCAGAYRYGFNGMEKDDEVKGVGNHYDLGLRNYDPRIGKMFSIDPRTPEYPWQSPYVYHRNNPILLVDFLGGGDAPVPDEEGTVEGQTTTTGGYGPNSSSSSGTAANTPKKTWIYHSGSTIGEQTNEAGWYSQEDYNGIIKAMAPSILQKLGQFDRGELQIPTPMSPEGVIFSGLDNPAIEKGDAFFAALESNNIEFSGGGANRTLVNHYTGESLWMPENEGLQSCNIIFDVMLGVGFAKGAYSTVIKSSTARARSLGIAGEEAVGIGGTKIRIPSLTGTAKYRIPDGLSKTTLTEVKNVKSLSYTRQIRDFHMFSQLTGRQFVIYARPTTTFSKPIQNLIIQGKIIVKPIPGL